MMPFPHSLQGCRFGNLLVIGWPFSKQGVYSQLCLCGCGKIISKSVYDLKNGRIKYCGRKCKNKPVNKKLAKAYRIWWGMVYRCDSPNAMQYENYGGRGIKVCARWRIYQNFLDDMGHPSQEQSLDRINNDGDYCPENCRWATRFEQANNTRQNVFISYNGERHSVSEWSRIVGIPTPTINNRYRLGYCPKDCLSKESFKGKIHRHKKYKPSE